MATYCTIHLGHVCMVAVSDLRVQVKKEHLMLVGKIPVKNGDLARAGPDQPPKKEDDASSNDKTVLVLSM